MKHGYGVAGVSLGAALLFWMTDAVLDLGLSGGEPFPGWLIADPSPRGLLQRLAGSLLFSVLGFLAAQTMFRCRRAEAEIGRLNAVLTGARSVHHLLNRETDPRRLLHGLCRHLHDSLGYPQVFLALLDPSGSSFLEVVAVGPGRASLEDRAPAEPLSPCFRRILEGNEAVFIENAARQCGDCLFSCHLAGQGAFCAPLIHGGRKLGVIAVSISAEPGRRRESFALFKELAEEIAFGLGQASERERARLQSQILDEIRDLVTITDLDGIILNISRAGVHALKREPQELIGKPTAFFGDASQGDVHREIIARTRGDGEWKGEIVCRAADGAEMILDYRTWLVRDDDGHPRYLAGVGRDITARKRMESDLAESRREMKILLDNLPGMAYRCRNDADWGMIFISDGCRTLTGYEPEELLAGRSVTYERIICSGDRNRVWVEIQQAIRCGRPFQIEYRIQCKDGQERWVWEQGRTVAGAVPGEVILEGLILDITERHRIQDALVESEGRFRRAQRIAQVGIWEFDLNRGMVFASEEARDIYGLNEKQEWTIPEVQKRPLPEYRPMLDRAMKALVEEGKPYEVDFKIRRPTDDAVVAIHSVAEYDSRRRRVLGALRDVTRQKEAESRLHQTTATLEALYRASPLPLIGLDPEGLVTHWSRAAEEMFGWKEAAVAGRPLPIISPEKEQDAEEIRRRLFSGEFLAGVEYDPVRRDGIRVPSLLFAAPVRDSENRISGTVSVLMDLTEQKKLQRRLAFLAYHDSLTGLSNRGHLKERFNQEMARAHRTKTRIALCLIDLDRFKLVNDTFGHPSGDELLCQVAIRLRGFIRGTDLVCRPGGDEFLIMLTDVKDLDGLTAAIRKIQSLFAEPFLLEGSSYKVSASIGISVFPDDGANIHQLFKNADNAMYHAKELGNNSFQFYREEMDGRVRDRMLLENGLRHALVNEEMTLHYQPLIDFAAGKVVGAEALLRWSHPKLGKVPPDQFIPVAEDTGMIVALGQWVIGEACRQLKRWRENGIEDLFLAVNISTVQLFDDRFIEGVARELSRNLPAEGRLAFELTESVFMKDQKMFRERILSLKGMGIAIYLDDFGTGYSSLSYLKMFEIDKLKIDKSFVRDIAHDANDLTLVAAMIQMAHNLGIRVVAEGVETVEQLELLQHNGCDQYQGFLSSKALPVEEFDRFLAGCNGGVAFAPVIVSPALPERGGGEGA
ncbi:MAG: EAL domain-containing protein [Deltaproteobacteria bacterium]|nr:EAL domain-containing protein [Deltaproteobacteria bacterium]